MTYLTVLTKLMTYLTVLTILTFLTGESRDLEQNKRLFGTEKPPKYGKQGLLLTKTTTNGSEWSHVETRRSLVNRS